MGACAGDQPMMPRLLELLAADGERLRAAAQAISGQIEFDAQSLLRRDKALDLQPPSDWSPNRHCRLIEATDGWIAVNLAREDDVRSVPAWIGYAQNAAPWDAIIAAAKTQHCAALLAQAQLLGMPVAGVREANPATSHRLNTGHSASRSAPLRVIDLSALWAGPLCGGLLAEAGAQVTKIESIGRADPSQHATPEHDARLNGRKQRITLDFSSADNLAQMIEMIAGADVLITSARPHALARLGLTPKLLFAANPCLIWVAITAYGWHGESAQRVGFGDDCAAAGGLLGWNQGIPRFIGDALADPLTGVTSAIAALEALAAGRCGLLDVALAPTAALYAQRAGFVI